ncbi:MAG: hypothetical protein U1F27_00740 [Turneriella sp.]
MKAKVLYKRTIGHRLCIFIFNPVMLVGCASYGDVYVAQDRYKQAKIVTLVGTHQSEETHGITNMPKSLQVNYSKSQKSGVSVPVEMKLLFNQAPEKMQLRASATVLIDSLPQEIQIININRTVHVSENLSRQYSWEPRETTSYKIFGTIVFSPELWQKMSGAKALAYQLTIDDLPYTFVLSPEMLEKLRLFSRQ